MRFYLPIVFLGLLMLAPISVSGRLRTLGDIESVGLVSDIALDLGVVLEGGEWEALTSSDGGSTWRLTKRVELPRTLGPLPAQAKVRYQFIDKRLLLRSDDSGATSHDVSPWRFLELAVRNDVEAEKKRFLLKYGDRLPESRAWIFIYALSVLVLLSIGAWYSRRVRSRWLAPVALSFAAYGLFGLAL